MTQGITVAEKGDRLKWLGPISDLGCHTKGKVYTVLSYLDHNNHARIESDDGDVVDCLVITAEKVPIDCRVWELTE